MEEYKFFCLVKDVTTGCGSDEEFEEIIKNCQQKQYDKGSYYRHDEPLKGLKLQDIKNQDIALVCW